MKKLFLSAMLLAVLVSACVRAPEPLPSPGPMATTAPSPMASPAPSAATTPSPTSAPSPEPTEEPKELWGFPIDDTHDAFELDTKGKLGAVLVTVEIEDTDPEEYHFSVWTKDDLKRPLQTMAAESYGVFHWNDVADVNFDGYMDFGYMYAMGNQPMYWHYWIWDEDKGQFVQEPEFDQISCPQFDKETGVISGWMRTSCCSGVYTYHRWEEGKLVCIRRITMDYPYTLTDESWEQVGTVEDRIDGKLVEVYREVAPANMPYYEFEHLFDWQDLNYHG